MELYFLSRENHIPTLTTGIDITNPNMIHLLKKVFIFYNMLLFLFNSIFKNSNCLRTVMHCFIGSSSKWISERGSIFLDSTPRKVSPLVYASIKLGVLLSIYISKRVETVLTDLCGWERLTSLFFSFSCFLLNYVNGCMQVPFYTV